jgi:hypothetical protein
MYIYMFLILLGIATGPLSRVVHQLRAAVAAPALRWIIPIFSHEHLPYFHLFHISHDYYLFSVLCCRSRTSESVVTLAFMSVSSGT